MKKAVKSKSSMLKLSKIVVDDAVHPREAVDQATVDEYAEAIKAGATFPPITVFQDGNKYFLADGRHRLEAFMKAGRKEIEANIRKGTERDAILYAVGANNKHGLRRTNADKRKAVEILLRDEEWWGWADNEIARKCNVSGPFVKNVRDEMKPSPHLQIFEDSPVRLVKRNGKVFTQKVGDRRKKAPDTISPAKPIGEMLSLTTEARDLLVAENKPKLVEDVDRISSDLQELLGKATGSKYRLEKGLGLPINVYERARGEDDGVKPNPEFAKKKLCTHSVGVGLSCGHQCAYCSTPSLLRTHAAFGEIHLTAFERGFAVIDPQSATRIKKNLPDNLTAENVIQLSTIDDAWAPEAREYDLGRKVMEVLLEETPAQIRVLTKCADVAKDFDLFKKYGERVIVGLSTGIPPGREEVARAVEPNASPVRARLEALRKAHDMGLRTYGMLCPCLPLVADRPEALQTMFDAVLECGVENIWLEPVNRRGKALVNTAAALRRAGLSEEAGAVDNVRKGENWSAYTHALIEAAIKVAREKKALDRLHVLLYPTGLLPAHLKALKAHPQGIIWLDKPEKPAKSAKRKAPAE